MGVTPWELKGQYYGDVVLGKKAGDQIKTLHQQTDVLVAANLASTAAVISSQERIAEGIEDIAYSMTDLAKGMEGLGAAFELGISQVVWQLEQNRDIYQGILETLQAPMGTQSKERRKWAEEAYQAGLIEDALEEYLAAEKLNKFDFTIHMGLGVIFLYEKKDPDTAIQYFERAIRYSRMKSSDYYLSWALMQKAAILRSQGKFEEALENAAQALESSPNLPILKYQCAQYNALLHRPGSAIPLLRAAISEDINFACKALLERDFDGIRDQLLLEIDRIRDDFQGKAISGVKDLMKLKKVLEPFFNSLKDKGNIKEWIPVQGRLDRIALLVERNRLLDSWEAYHLTLPTFWGMVFLSRQMIDGEDNEVLVKQSDRSDACNKNEIFKKKLNSTALSFWVLAVTTFVLVAVVGLIYAFIHFNDHGRPTKLVDELANAAVIVIFCFLVLAGFFKVLSLFPSSHDQEEKMAVRETKALSKRKIELETAVAEYFGEETGCSEFRSGKELVKKLKPREYPSGIRLLKSRMSIYSRGERKTEKDGIYSQILEQIAEDAPKIVAVEGDD